MDINIKNMVCNRCIKKVSQIFNLTGIEVENVQLGKVETAVEVNPDNKISENKNANRSTMFEFIIII